MGQAGGRGGRGPEATQIVGRPPDDSRLVRDLLGSFPGGSVNVFDEDLRYLLAEGRGLEEAGMSSEALVGRTLRELFHPEAVALAEPHYRRAFRGDTVTFDLLLGERVYVTNAAPLHRDEDGRVRTVIAVAMDVTPLRSALEARERARRLEAAARVQAQERRRIGRELHDRVSHHMALVHQGLELYEALRGADPERAEEKLGQAKRATQEAMRWTRDLSGMLRVPETALGLAPALSELLGAELPSGTVPRLSVEGDEATVAPAVREQLFLVLREAVRNAASHSGGGEVEVAVRIGPERVLGVVEDDGRGFEVGGADTGGGGGLGYMAERASLLGGSYSVGPRAGGGTRVEVSFPLAGG